MYNKNFLPVLAHALLIFDKAYKNKHITMTELLLTMSAILEALNIELEDDID